VREFLINRNDAGQRLDRFLTKQGLPISAIMKALRKKDIKVNGKRGLADYKLVEGDILRVFALFPAEGGLPPQALRKFFGISTSINIIYEDENIILIDKPVGLLCHDGNNSLIDRVKAYLYKKGEFVPENEQSFEPALCNRIDRNTGGIVIAAKNAESLRAMNEKIKLRLLTKLYVCILSKIPEKKEAKLTAFLEKHESATGGSPVTVSNKKTEYNKTIITKYRVIGENKRAGLALAEVDLLTGRTHQIRAHMAYIGCPLLGDGKYGSKKFGKQFGFDKQALYSYKLVFNSQNEDNNNAERDETSNACACLDYLCGKSFEVEREKIWFVEKFWEL
jgi:23S rRNA pseudouridine955/2504/2580 synthase